VCTEEFGLPRLKDLKGAKVRGLSEEHCTLDLSDPKCKLKPGHKIELIPTHGCTTINLHDQFFALRGDKVEAVWPIEARGRAR
ncbi:MAG: DSD1 family PLP-dependent enzyme, partial [Planctomycetes bacterium]|nr:DSD1 family PLP-dependent enzyme [Planctomycetota bacterium]